MFVKFDINTQKKNIIMKSSFINLDLCDIFISLSSEYNYSSQERVTGNIIDSVNFK